MSASVAQLRRERLVRVHRVGPHGVAADLGDHDAAQERERHRLVEERHVGVPVGGGRARRGVDLLEQRLVGRRLDRRVAERERPEPAGERDLALVVERLIAEEHDLVLEQCAPDVGHRLVVELAGEVDARELGADRAGERRDLEAARGRVRSFGMPRLDRSGRPRATRGVCPQAPVVAGSGHL